MLLDPESLEINGDPLRVTELAGNLLANAIQYNTDGGRIDVRVERVDGQARLSIADTGIGISLEDQAHLFERFFRADRSRTRASGGSGLGLAIGKEIVTAHGGSIRVDSRPGAGTTVTALFPLARDEVNNASIPPFAESTESKRE
jgi:signal transduction histidine kinase